jgi:23S rRNA G2445 N2-methylase RlmL
VDLGRSAELAVLDRFPAWRLVEDDAQLELWVQLMRSSLIAGLRLSDNMMRQRTYRKVSLPAALKPTVAAAMVLLSEPQDGDVFLDPMCGSGTILIERALAGRYRLLIGGDADPEAIHATRENIGPRYKPIEIHRWDARSLPLEDDSVSTIVTNLPFGKQIGTPVENRTLYPALLAEWVRVLRPGGRMVLLTSEQALLRRSLQRHPHLHLRRQIPVIVRGQRATISVIHSLEEGSDAR